VLSEAEFAVLSARMEANGAPRAEEEAPAPAAKQPDMREALIEAECTKILEEDGWRALRTDPVSDRSKGKGFGEVGMADHLYIRYKCTYGKWTKRNTGPDASWLAESQVVWIEFKRPGKDPAKHQIEWHTKERARGALTLIAGQDFPASIEGFKQWYANSGLQRRREK
jgi:hypothetical protein